MTDLATPPLVLPGNLRRYQWKRFVRGPDQELLDDLHVPKPGNAHNNAGQLLTHTVEQGANAPHKHLSRRL